MEERSSKEIILKKVRKALLQQSEPMIDRLDLDSDVFVPEEGELIETFASNFIANNGIFSYCYNEYHFADQFLAAAEANDWQHVVCLEKEFQDIFAHCDYPLFNKSAAVKEAEVGLSGCDALVSRTGSVILTSSGNYSRTLTIFPPVHAVVAYRNQLVYDLKNYLSRLSSAPIASLPSMVSIVSGPSRTADIEKTLVLGAHGPKQIHLFFIDQDKDFAVRR